MLLVKLPLWLVALSSEMMPLPLFSSFSPVLLVKVEEKRALKFAIAECILEILEAAADAVITCWRFVKQLMIEFLASN